MQNNTLIKVIYTAQSNEKHEDAMLDPPCIPDSLEKQSNIQQNRLLEHQKWNI